MRSSNEAYSCGRPSRGDKEKRHENDQAEEHKPKRQCPYEEEFELLPLNLGDSDADSDDAHPTSKPSNNGDFKEEKHVVDMKTISHRADEKRDTRHVSALDDQRRGPANTQDVPSPETLSISDLDMGGRYAYVALVYGTEAGYCIEAAVLAHSLKKTKTKYALLLMHTNDVSQEWLTVLAESGWDLRPVEYIYPGNRSTPEHLRGKRLYKGGRFSAVFTKLWCLTYTEFDKVLFLDTDLLVRRPIDHLFNRQAPAALRRQARGDGKDNEKINGDEFFFDDGSLAGGINAGVMLLKPKANDFENISRCIALEDAPCHSPSTQPEQDFLTMYYGPEWWSLGVEYNYQLHQLAYCVRPGNEYSHRVNMSYDEVRILHYSAKPKPSDWLLDRSQNTKEQFTNQIVDNYKKLLRGELQTAKSKPFYVPDAKKARHVRLELEARTRISCMEWYNCWDALVTESRSWKTVDIEVLMEGAKKEA